MPTLIWHNPACGTSRNTLALIRATGAEPEIVEYLKATPAHAAIAAMIAAAGLTVRAAIRQKGTPYAELGLDNPALTEDQLLDATAAHPILVNRPFVRTDRGTRLCRPSELVLEILETPLTDDFVKEDGEIVLARRV